MRGSRVAKWDSTDQRGAGDAGETRTERTSRGGKLLQHTTRSVSRELSPKGIVLAQTCRAPDELHPSRGPDHSLTLPLSSPPQWYYHTHSSVPSLASIARMIQTMLYGKRFFPYYAYVIRTSFPIPSSYPPAHSQFQKPAVGGIDRDGTGAVYSFDPVGSYERESCRAAGAAQSLVQPFLDNMVRPPPPPAPPPPSSHGTDPPLTGLQQEPSPGPGPPRPGQGRATHHPPRARPGPRDGRVHGRDGEAH